MHALGGSGAESKLNEDVLGQVEVVACHSECSHDVAARVAQGDQVHDAVLPTASPGSGGSRGPCGLWGAGILLRGHWGRGGAVSTGIPGGQGGEAAARGRVSGGGREGWSGARGAGAGDTYSWGP